MKSEQVLVRVDGATKRYLKFAAAFDRKTLSAFIIHSALAYADQLRARGWGAKPPPAPRDHRRKV